jgi:3-dehydroshikimate dehydratase
MIYSGLVSVTFRKLEPKEIVKLVVKAGLTGIEWGGDIHVPHGNIEKAKEVCKLTLDNGLRAASYGSYYYVGCEGEKGIYFGNVLETALELKTQNIRVWAGNRGSDEADDAWWDKVINETVRISETARMAGINISFEYHGGTLTDTDGSTVKLMSAVSGRNVFSYWQPPIGLPFKEQLKGLNNILDWLGNIHVYWWNETEIMHLSSGADIWKKYMEVIKRAKGDRYCMLEFVCNDDPLQFLEDAKTLKKILE